MRKLDFVINKTENNQIYSKVVYYDYTGIKVQNRFKCGCGCEIVYRPKKQYSYSFWEGFFHCRNCKKQINYYSDEWVKSLVFEPKQLELL